jgi:hypothetical protein
VQRRDHDEVARGDSGREEAGHRSRGLSYMLTGDARQGQGIEMLGVRAKDPSQVKEWFYIGPMIMVVLPDAAKDALRGINQDLSNNQPYTTLYGSADIATPLWVIPIAKGGASIKEVPAK